jgi:hypothetical protein
MDGEIGRESEGEMLEPFNTQEDEDTLIPSWGLRVRNDRKFVPSWKKRSKEFCEDSTFHGALYVFASKSWIKRIFWAIIILTAFAGFITVSLKHIVDLTSEPIATSITVTRERELPFPAVTLCSLSLLNVTTLQSGGPNVVNNLVELFDDILYDSDITACKVQANELARATGFNGSWGELTDVAYNDLAVLLLNCSYAGEKCTVKDFEPINTVGGRCFTFNRPQPPRVAHGTGIRQGLRLRLSPEQQEFSLNRDSGFRIVIHNPDELPRPESEGVVVGLASTVYIGMRQVTSIDENTGRQCRSDAFSDSRELIFSGYPSYSPNLCQAECFYKYAANKCGCIEKNLYTPVGGRYSQLRTCAAPDLCCAVEAFDEVEENCDCLPRCKTVERTLTVSSSTNQDDSVGVNVFYESLALEKRVTTNSYTPWSFVSDIGGNSALFLGLTLLSCVELLMLLVGLIKDCCFCKRSETANL